MMRTRLKRVIFNARRADIDDARFLHHWLTVHAPLVVAAPQYERYVAGYQQAIPVRGMTLPGAGWPSEFLSLSEFWPRDLPEGEPPLAATDYFQRVINPDVDLFVDRDHSLQALADEEILVPRSGVYRVIVLLRRRADLGRPAFEDQLAADHARQRSTADFWDHVSGYARCHLRPGGLTTYAGQPVTDLSFDVIEEFSFQTPRAALAAFQSDGYRALIQPAEAAFLDGGRATSLLVRDASAFA